MIDAALVKPPTFTVIVVHSFSRFFPDQFQFEFDVRKLAKNGVRLISITQDLGDDPMSVMMRQIMTLFDEYQSKENAKHTLRAMKENARQRYWNGALPPIGYRIVAAEQRGAKIKKKLEIDPIHADTVRLIYRLALNGDGDRGRREEWNERRRGHIAELRKRAAEAEAKLKRLYEAIENGVVDMANPSLRDRIAELTALRDQARADAERATSAVELLGPAITSGSLRRFALAARRKLRNEDGTYRRDHLRALAQRVEVVDPSEIRILGTKTELLRTLIAAAGVESAAAGVRSFIPKWRATVDEDGHYSFAVPL